MKGLVKRYPGFQLGPVTLELDPGEAYGLLGPNGAGKTTLLNCLACQSRLDAGSFRWRGRPVHWGDWRYRGEISFVRETPALYEGLTAGQLLRFASRIYPAWDDRFARDWQARLHLPTDRKVGAFSKGMRVKLSLLVALAHGARLILLDEPTAGLDPDARADLHALLRQLVEKQRACLLISSHIFEDIESVCDEVMILHQGAIVFSSRLSELRKRSVRDVYFAIERGKCAP